ESPPLTPAQAAALAPVEAAIAAGRAERLLLHGVTGSGKTEVYLSAAEAALARGRSAIVLVPEIALTPQIVARFAARFGDTVAVLHSRMGRGQRYDEWRQLPRVRLPERVDGRPLPPVDVVDMRGAAHALHPRTREALERVRRERRKAIVLLNRRGWSNFLSCRSCGRVWECPHCDVALV